jgi:hypothetical protein
VGQAARRVTLIWRRTRDDGRAFWRFDVETGDVDAVVCVDVLRYRYDRYGDLVVVVGDVRYTADGELASCDGAFVCSAVEGEAEDVW